MPTCDECQRETEWTIANRATAGRALCGDCCERLGIEVVPAAWTAPGARPRWWDLEKEPEISDDSAANPLA